MKDGQNGVDGLDGEDGEKGEDAEVSLDFAPSSFHAKSAAKGIMFEYQYYLFNFPVYCKKNRNKKM